MNRRRRIPLRWRLESCARRTLLTVAALARTASLACARIGLDSLAWRSYRAYVALSWRADAIPWHIRCGHCPDPYASTCELACRRPCG